MRKKWKIGYKVVYQEKGNLFSCFKNFQPYRDRIRFSKKYELNKSTIRNSDGGPMAVFNSFEDAKRFCLGCRDLKMYKCKYIESKDTCLWFDYYSHIFCPRIEGTRFADEVKLSEFIPKKTKQFKGIT